MQRASVWFWPRSGLLCGLSDSPYSRCHCRDQLCMSSNSHHTGSIWSTLPPALRIPYCYRGSECLKSSPWTHLNATGSDELRYSGENTWHMRHRSWQIAFLLMYILYGYGFLEDSITKSSNWLNLVAANKIRHPHIGSPRLILLSPHS